jgi:sec-independent protein translocase protein TatC
MTEPSPTLLRFLTELRKRLIISLIALGIIFGVLFCFANTLYTWLALPLLKALPKGHGLISTTITGPFLVPFEFTFVTALFVAVPFFLYQLWAFVAPALYLHERRLVWPLLFISIMLFYAGVAFAYFIIFPLLFVFFTRTVPVGVMFSPDISHYLDFTLQLFFIFGVIFEVPVITVLVISSGVFSREKLISLRRYVIVGAFIIGMLLGPPDVLSQIMLALPLWLLFEVGLFCSVFFEGQTVGRMQKHDS